MQDPHRRGNQRFDESLVLLAKACVPAQSSPKGRSCPRSCPLQDTPPSDVSHQHRSSCCPPAHVSQQHQQPCSAFDSVHHLCQPLLLYRQLRYWRGSIARPDWVRSRGHCCRLRMFCGWIQALRCLVFAATAASAPLSGSAAVLGAAWRMHRCPALTCGWPAGRQTTQRGGIIKQAQMVWSEPWEEAQLLQQ